MHINIEGDGNVIGHGNRVIVDKRVVIRNKFVNNGGGNEKRDPNNEVGLAGAVGIAVAIALAVAAWKFAQHAPFIYALLKGAGLSAGFLLMAATYALHNKQPARWLTDQTIGGAAVVLAVGGIWISANSYPTQLTELALQTGQWKDFWCGLTTQGTELATLHMLSMSVLAVPALLLAWIGVIGALARWLFVVSGTPWIGRVAMIQTRWIAGVSLGLAITCFVSQLDFSQQWWAGVFETQGSKTMGHFLCPTRR